MSSWIDALRPECGPLSEAANRFAAMRGFLADPPRGVPALRDLLSAIREQSEGGDGSTDESFIEGAGAFLGVVLAERFGTARHVSDGSHHGLQMGQHGYFDPFDWVARTLDADQQADTLLLGVAEAEAEAESRTHCAHLLSMLAQAFRELGTELQIQRRVGQRIWLQTAQGTLEVDLGRLLSVTKGEPDSVVSRACARFAQALVGNTGRAEEPYTETRHRLMPRLIGPAFKGRLAGSGQAPALVEVPWYGPLSIALVLQYEGRARYMSLSDLQAWRVPPKEALNTALANLAERPIRVERAGSGSQAVVRIRTGDGYDATRILLPTVQHTLSEILPESLRVALPHRDTLLACSSQDATTVHQLQRQAQMEARTAPHAVSENLWACGPTGQWMPVAI